MPSRPSSRASQSWDAVADWYAGWSGPHGSNHHRMFAIPALIDLLDPRPGEHILDLGCGPGPLVPAIIARGARYTGIDTSAKLLALGRRHHGGDARFVLADATRPGQPDLAAGGFAAATFLLSLQDIDPLEAAIATAAQATGPLGRIVIVMTHPCFRIPRQSGWGWDDARKLQYRRIDRYLGRLAIPMEAHGRGGGATRSYHRPLGAYVEALAGAGFAIDALREIAVDHGAPGRARAEANADREIPLFLAIRALKRM